MKKDLVILEFTSAAFTDLSIDLNNYDVDEANLSLIADTDFLYIGLYKSFKNLYIDVKDNTTPGTVKYEFFNGTTWEVLTVTDESKNLTRSGFVKWDIPSTWVATTVNGIKAFFIRATATIVVTLNGINMVFANDNDLKEHYRQINEYRDSDLSFIAMHQASRKDIIQAVRNSGKTKIDSIDGLIDDLTIWDFLDPEQLRNAATYLCLSKIFQGVSDNSEGKFMQLSNMFRKAYKNSLDTFLLTIDANDDGITDSSEQREATRKGRVVFT